MPFQLESHHLRQLGDVVMYHLVVSVILHSSNLVVDPIHMSVVDPIHMSVEEWLSKGFTHCPGPPQGQLRLIGSASVKFGNYRVT